MIGNIVHTDWLNENRNRKYPFFDEMTLRDTSDSMTLPNEFIVDMTMPVWPNFAGVETFALRSVVISDVSITLSFWQNGEEVATCTIVIAEHVENQTYTLAGNNASFIFSIGRVTIGRLNALLNFGGVYVFDAGAALLLPSIMRPCLNGVSSLSVRDSNNELLGTLYGDIEIVAGDNIELSLIPPNITISAIDNPAYDQGCVCNDAPSGAPILTINGIHPDSEGEFKLLGEGCVNISSITNGIQLNDTCATPCCGCEELAVLRDELARLDEQINTQSAFAQRAFANIEQLRDNVLASRLGPGNPCD